MSWTDENKENTLKLTQENLQMRLERTILLEEVTKLRAIEERIPRLVTQWDKQFQTLSNNFEQRQKHHQNEVSEKIKNELNNLKQTVNEQLETLSRQNKQLHQDNQALLSNYEHYMNKHVEKINQHYHVLVKEQTATNLATLANVTKKIQQAQIDTEKAMAEFTQKQLTQVKLSQALKEIALSGVYLLMILAVIWIVGYLLGTFFHLDDLYRWVVASTIGKVVLWVLGLSLLAGVIGSVVSWIKN